MSAEEIKKIRDEVDKIKAQLRSGDEAKRAEFIKKYEEFKKKYPAVFKPSDDTDLDCPEGQHYDVPLGKCVPNTPPGCPELPSDGRPQPHKGASTDANNWKVVPMKDDPNIFKVVDNADINVADLFKTQANAEQYIAHYLCTPAPTPEPTPTPGPDPVPAPGGKAGPYASTGKELGHTIRGPTTRHYRSGKPDDRTIETNTKGIPYKNYQFIVYTTMHKVEHSDTISLKFGGTHMGSGWYDCGISFGDGQGEVCLGKEEDHPSTNLCVVRGPKIGDILEKKIGIAGVYFNRGDKAHIEMWTDFPAGSGWKKQLEGDNVGGFYPKSDEDEAQQRIDGFETVPTLHSAVVQEIADGSTPAPTPQPTPEPSPTPQPTPQPTPSEDKIYPDTVPPHISTTVIDGELEQGGDRREPQITGYDFLNCEATAYVKVHGVKDTLSIKLRGPKHSGIPDDDMCNNIHYINLGSENKKPFGKQSGHTKEYCEFGSQIVKIPDNVWVGVKAIEYNENDDKSVHFQTWVQNPEGSAWKLASDFVDNGSSTGCGGSDPRAGKPYVTSPCQDLNYPVSVGFRVDGLKGGGDVEFKNLSVREIKAPV